MQQLEESQAQARARVSVCKTCCSSRNLQPCARRQSRRACQQTVHGLPVVALQADTLAKERATLVCNISVLYRTAVAELDWRTREIDTLRKRVAELSSIAQTTAAAPRKRAGTSPLAAAPVGAAAASAEPVKAVAPRAPDAAKKQPAAPCAAGAPTPAAPRADSRSTPSAPPRREPQQSDGQLPARASAGKSAERRSGGDAASGRPGRQDSEPHSIPRDQTQQAHRQGGEGQRGVHDSGRRHADTSRERDRERDRPRSDGGGKDGGRIPRPDARDAGGARARSQEREGAGARGGDGRQGGDRHNGRSSDTGPPKQHNAKCATASRPSERTGQPERTNSGQPAAQRISSARASESEDGELSQGAAAGAQAVKRDRIQWPGGRGSEHQGSERSQREERPRQDMSGDRQERRAHSPGRRGSQTHGGREQDRGQGRSDDGAQCRVVGSKRQGTETDEQGADRGRQWHSEYPQREPPSKRPRRSPSPVRNYG